MLMNPLNVAPLNRPCRRGGWMVSLSIWVIAATLSGAPINPNDILVSIGEPTAGTYNPADANSNTVREFTLEGIPVQTIPFKYKEADYLHGSDYHDGGIATGGAYPPGEHIRDIVVDQNGFIDAFNGTFDPFLSRYSPVEGSFTHQAFPLWSCFNSTQFGGIAAYQKYVFVANTLNWGGIYRYDTFARTWVRFGSPVGFMDLSTGADGKLYGLFTTAGYSAGATDINVYDPETLALLRSVRIPDEAIKAFINSAAVDAQGRIFVVSKHGTIYRLDSSGALQLSVPSGFDWTSDIDIDENGRVIIGQQDGRVVMTDIELSAFTSFLAVNDPHVSALTVFVSFARAVPRPLTPIPTPPPTPAPTATPVPSHDIVVSLGTAFEGSGTSLQRNTVREFSPSGAFLRSIPFPDGTGNYTVYRDQTEFLHDLVVDDAGVISAFNGSFTPQAYLSRYSDTTQSISSTTYAGWTTYADEFAGGIAQWGKYIYVTDMNTGDAYFSPNGRLSGIVRFNTADGSAARFTDGIDFTDLNLGLDGKLYALVSRLNSGGGLAGAATINVYDPLTMVLLRTVQIPAEIASNDAIYGVAVDQSGRIFLCGRGGAVHRLTSDGRADRSEATGFHDLTDIDVDETGRVIMSQADSRVVTGYTTLDGFESFLSLRDPTQLDWATYVAFAPLLQTNLANLSTRGNVGTGDNVLIAGFIVKGDHPKKVMVRGIGPTLAPYGVANTLSDPRLELHDGAGGLIATNDNWNQTQTGGVVAVDQYQEILRSGIPPPRYEEPSILATLPPGNYTAVMQGVNGTTGTGLVEVYDMTGGSARLGNISTRGLVQTGDGAMIGGVIIPSNVTKTVIVRAMGPSLPLSQPLADPTLELHDGNGALVAANNNWRDTQEQELQASGIPPSNDLESAIMSTLTPGNYTAIVRGFGNATGVGLVEFYDVR